jgi:hypothetical protein
MLDGPLAGQLVSPATRRLQHAGACSCTLRRNVGSRRRRSGRSPSAPAGWPDRWVGPPTKPAQDSGLCAQGSGRRARTPPTPDRTPYRYCHHRFPGGSSDGPRSSSLLVNLQLQKAGQTSMPMRTCIRSFGLVVYHGCSRQRRMMCNKGPVFGAVMRFVPRWDGQLQKDNPLHITVAKSVPKVAKHGLRSAGRVDADRATSVAVRRRLSIRDHPLKLWHWDRRLFLLLAITVNNAARLKHAATPPSIWTTPSAMTSAPPAAPVALPR